MPLIYDLDGDNPVIVASKGGAPDHPGWFKNLAKTPEAEVQIQDRHFRVRAREAEGEERARLWAADERDVAALRRVRRRGPSGAIPVVVLERE